MPVRTPAVSRVRLLALVVLLGAVVAAPASAAWRELPAYDVSGGAGASCLSATGPGGLVLDAGARRSQLLSVDAAAIAVSDELAGLGRIDVCTEAATLPQPPLAVTGIRIPGSGRVPRQRLVAIDGAGRRTVLTRGPVWVMAPTVAATASGAAVVAWLETGSPRRGTAVMAATRPSADAPFGAPQRLGRSAISYTTVRAGIDDSGRAHVAWFENGGRSGALHVASAAPGAGFAPARKLGEGSGFLAAGALALSVAPDGRALVAGPLGDRLGLWELAPLGDGFRRIARLEAPSDQIALALQPGGAAVLAARSDERAPIVLVRRPAGGSFGEPEVLLPPADLPPPRRSHGSQVTFTSEGELDSGLSAALSPSGEIVVTTHAPASSEGPAWIAAWRGTLAGAGSGRVVRDGRERIRIAGRARSLGSACRTATDVVPLQLADGRLAIAWSDDGRSRDFLGLELAVGSGRVHVAIPSEAAPAPSTPPVAPRLRARLLGDGVVGSGTPLRLRVSCGDAPCDVRAEAAVVPFSATAESVGRVTPIAVASTPVAAGRRGELRLAPSDQAAFARPGRRARPAISLTACTPDGAAVTRTTLRPSLRGRPLSPQPRIVGLRAVRRGSTVVVSWRLSRPAPRGSSLEVAGWRGDFPVAFPRRRPQRAGAGFRSVLRIERRNRPFASGPLEVVVSLATPETPDAAEAHVVVR